MKETTKRILSFVLALLIFASLTATCVSAATWTTYAYVRFFAGGNYDYLTNTWPAFSSGSYYYDQTYSATTSTGANAYQKFTISPPTPVLPGFDFLGWCNMGTREDNPTIYNELSSGSTALILDADDVSVKQGGSVYIGTSGVTSSTNRAMFVACYERKKYNITYVLNNGNSNVVEQKKHGYAYTIASNVNPQKEGYYILGWDTDSSADAVAYSAGDKYLSDKALTLYAVWDKATYTVNYNSNGGLGAPESQNTIIDDGKMIPATIPYRAGYVFSGWAKSPESLTADFMPGDLLPNENLDLYALWSPEISAPGIAICGTCESEPDNTIFEDIYLKLTDIPTYININIEYPEFLSYNKFEASDLEEGIEVTENIKSDTKVLNISAYNKDGLFEEGLIRIGRLYLDVNFSDDYLPDTYTLSVDDNDSYVIVGENQTAFSDIKNQEFALLPCKAKSISIEGENSVKSATQYNVAFVPDKTANQSVEWSVSDESIAVVDSQGVLTPIKNGTVTLYAKTMDGTDITAEKSIEIVGQPAVIDNITVSKGVLSPSFDSKEFMYTVYVPDDCDSVKLTADFANGNLVCDNYGSMISGIEKTIYLNSDLQEIVLSKSEDGYTDQNYFFTFIRKSPLAIYGKETISNSSDYSLIYLPESKVLDDVIWSVDDEKMATIDSVGVLTPLKNGTVTISAKSESVADFNAEKNVTLVNLPILIDNITIQDGEWSAEFNPHTFEYTVSVSSDCDSIKFMAEFSEGVLINDKYGEISSGDEVSIEITSELQEFIFVRKAESYIDSEYKITIIRKAVDEPPSSVPGTSTPTKPGDNEPTLPTEPSIPDETEPTEPSTGGETEPTEPSAPDETEPTEPSTGGETEPTEPSTPDETKPTEPIEDNGLLGDVNGDGKVNVKDATLIQKAAAKITKLTDDENMRADVNGDSKVNVKDATAIQKFAAKIETGFPIGEKIVSKENN